MAKKRTKTKKWRKPHHGFYRMFANGILTPYIKAKYGFSPTPFTGDRKRQYLVVSNHQTPLDQFFISMSFRKTFYFVASEDLFSNGAVSKIMKHAISPIPIRKQTSDFSAVMTCAKVAKEGGSIIIFPEGNRTYSGKTEYVNPSITKFVNLLKLPLVIYRIEGGYGVYPRWSNKIRKGKMRAYVSQIIEYEEYSKLSNQELYKLIVDGLNVNDAVKDELYYTKNNAEYLERLLYVCPDCGLTEFKSQGNFVTCKKCNKKVEYLASKELKCADGDLPFNFVNDWYEYQKRYINALDISLYKNKIIYREKAKTFEVILYKDKKLLDKDSIITLYGNAISFTHKGKITYCDFDRTSAVTVLGRNKLNVYYQNQVFQFKGDKSFNAIKYVHIFNRYLNYVKGDENGFLGL